mgnify:CR=1 FL=1|jgi:hypothetical protein
MNRIKCLLVVIFFSLLEADAQILVGPVVGGNANTLIFKSREVRDQYKFSPELGYHAGASLSFRVRNRFFLQSSLLYSVRNKTLIENPDNMPYDGDFSNSLNLKYLEMPILYTAEFKRKVGKRSDKEFKWYFGVGPTVSYWLGGKGTLSDGDLFELNIQSLPYKVTFNKSENAVQRGEMNVQDANRIQLSLNVSAGLIFEPFGLHKIMVAMRYEHGHSFLSQDSKGYFGGFDGDLYYQDDLQVRLHGIYLSLHYFVDLKTDQRKKGKSNSKVKQGKSKN